MLILRRFRIFTNYDGNGASVKGNSIGATSNNSVEAEAYAFQNGAQFYVVIVNKIGKTLDIYDNPKFLFADSPLPVVVKIPEIQQGKVEIYSFSNTRSLGLVGSGAINNQVLQLTLDAWSATLLVTV